MQEKEYYLIFDLISLEFWLQEKEYYLFVYRDFLYYRAFGPGGRSPPPY